MRNIIPILFLCLTNLISMCQSQVPQQHSDFPLVIDSSNNSQGILPPTLIADLNRDGQKEIIVAIPLPSSSSKLFVIKNDGSNQQGFPKQYNNTNIDHICSGDIDGDGYLDIVFRDNDFIHVLNRFGNEVQGFPAPYSYPNGFLDKYTALYDLDGSGRLEIIAGKENELAVFNSNGQMRSGWPQRLVGSTAMGPAIGDLDGDGFAEIILGTIKRNPIDSGRINIFKNDGSNFSANWPVYIDPGYFIDLGSPSLLINRNHIDSTYIFVPQTGENNLNRISKYDIYGNKKAEVTVYALDDFGTPAIGDLNRDGRVEIACGTASLHDTYVFTDNLVPLPGWPQEGGGSDFWQIAIGKLTAGNNLNVISVNNSSWMFGYGHIFVYDINVAQLVYSPLRPFSLMLGISLADIDNDGSVELIAVGEGFNKYYLQVLTFPGIPYNNADFPWPTFAHDRYRTNQYGFIPPDETIGIKPISNNIPKQFKLYQNYPNPFNPLTKIEFDIKQRSQVTIKIYDLLGRVVSKLVDEALESGSYKINFDGTNLASGIYFAKIESYATGQNSNLLFADVIKLSLVK